MGEGVAVRAVLDGRRMCRVPVAGEVQTLHDHRTRALSLGELEADELSREEQLVVVEEGDVEAVLFLPAPSLGRRRPDIEAVEEEEVDHRPRLHAERLVQRDDLNRSCGWSSNADAHLGGDHRYFLPLQEEAEL